MGVERKLIAGAFEDEDLVGRLFGGEVELLNRPLKDALDLSRGWEARFRFPVVEDRHCDPFASMAMDVVPMPNLIAIEREFRIESFLAIFEEDQWQVLAVGIHPAVDRLDDVDYCGILTELYQLGIHTVLGMNIEFNFFHIFCH